MLIFTIHVQTVISDVKRSNTNMNAIYVKSHQQKKVIGMTRKYNTI